jgi:uncharacterized C2H2 Zn-finger protein
MGIADHIVETGSFKELCPNCSRHDADYVTHVDRYGRERSDGSEGLYCARCGYCFETD